MVFVLDGFLDPISEMADGSEWRLEVVGQDVRVLAKAAVLGQQRGAFFELVLILDGLLVALLLRVTRVLVDALMDRDEEQDRLAFALELETKVEVPVRSEFRCEDFGEQEFRL